MYVKTQKSMPAYKFFISTLNTLSSVITLLFFPDITIYILIIFY